ncbi:MAG: N-acetylneuraminate synthase family protein [Candidatus Omnitrophica bacterium]|nr:N-acetylneuraminate synthase family protein [Candidatus Omnitrophota bacterium]
MKRIQIQNRVIGPGNPCFIIAEAGLNHNGNPELAAKLIETAARCKADAVKFQTYTTRELFAPDHPDYEKFEKHVFTREIYEDLMQHAERNDILFLSTPFDEASADLLESLGIPAFKIGSGELTHLRFLKHLASKKKPMILSTGMATDEQVDKAVAVVQSMGDIPLALLHCVSAYPCPLEEANVHRMSALMERYDFPIGYSDHTESNTAAMAAVSLGACIIEKHITLSHHLPGWDHNFSTEPEAFKRYVQTIRDIETALGTGEKKLTPSEILVHEIARRSIYARKSIQAGEALTQENLIVRRPVGPLSADQFESVLGKTALRSISKGTALHPQDFEN